MSYKISGSKRENDNEPAKDQVHHPKDRVANQLQARRDPVEHKHTLQDCYGRGD